MSNMSYCRFENTNRDLNDCCGALETFFYEDSQEITGEERRYAASLIQKCHEILELVASQTGKNLSTFIDENDHDMEETATKIITKIGEENDNKNDSE